jgi:hypothetical protein
MKSQAGSLTAAWVIFACMAAYTAAQDVAPKPPEAGAHETETPFLVKPYLQLGHMPAPGKLVLVWHAADVDADWAVEYQAGTGTRWQAASSPIARRIAVAGTLPHRVYHVALTGLQPGEMFGYRIRSGNHMIISAEARAPRLADQPQRFVVFGDCGAGTAEEKAIAYRAYLSRPDFLMITGDIVYGEGRIAEYREKYWPILNADNASSSEGAPLLRSILSVAAPGNHDIAHRDLAKIPDGLAYFYYWLQPLNGPIGKEGDALVAPVPGPAEHKKAFLDAAGDAFPQARSPISRPPG